MTFSPLVPVSTVLETAAVLGGLAVIAYILKMRRRRFEVPFSGLWQRVLKEKDTTSLWKHLRRILSLLLQLVIIGLLLFAVLDPKLGRADPDAKNVVVIIDTSASMKTVDESLRGADGPVTRLAAAKHQVVELLRGMGGGDEVMLMRMDGQTTPLTRFESDLPRLNTVVQKLQASDTPADLRRALSGAADALRGRRNPMIVLVGDGAYPEEVLGSVLRGPPVAQPQTPPPAKPAADDGTASFANTNLTAIDLRGIDLRYLPVGKRADNVGIVAFNVRRYITNKTAYEVFIEVQNFGREPARRKLELYSGDLAIDVKELTLKPGERKRQLYPNLGGGTDHRLRAVLKTVDGADDARADGHDIFALDDEAFALLPKRTTQKVLLVTKDNLYLEGAMLVYDNVGVDKLLPDDYETAVAGGNLPAYDAVVFDDYTPEHLPPDKTNLLYFNPSGKNSPFPIRRTLERPHITEVDPHHPVTKWIVMNDVNFDKSSVFGIDRAKGEVPLLTSVRAPIGAAKKDGQHKVVAFGFSLTGTDLTLRVAFPLLLANILDWFAGDDSDLVTTYRTGRRLWVPMDGTYGVTEVAVIGPSGRQTRAPVVDGRATFYGHAVGVSRLEAEKDGTPVAQIELAANLANPAESNVSPGSPLYVGGDTDHALEPPAGFDITHRQSLWLYLVLAVLLLLGLEWITYNRRVTV